MSRVLALVATFAAVFATLADAQEAAGDTTHRDSVRGREIGLVLGTARSRIWRETDGLSSVDAQYYPSITAGVAMRWNPARRITLETDALLTGKGEGSETNSGRRLQYLEVPALWRVGGVAPAGIPVMPYLLVGPSFGMLLSCSVVYYGASPDCGDPRFLTRRFGVAVLGGVGVDVRTSPEDQFALELRWANGLSDIEAQAGVKDRSETIYVMVWYWHRPLTR
jgi:outer membrane protein with beta-barrel domain